MHCPIFLLLLFISSPPRVLLHSEPSTSAVGYVRVRADTERASVGTHTLGWEVPVCLLSLSSGPSSLWRDLQSREGLAGDKFRRPIANEQNQGDEGVRIPSVTDVKK